MIKLTGHIYLFLILHMMSLCGYASPFRTDPSLQANMAALSIDSIKKHVAVLGSDSLQGRGTGQKGGYLAAQYIESRLRMYGLDPLQNGSFRQNIPMHGSQIVKSSALELFSGGNEYSLRPGIDYQLNNYGAQTFTPRQCRLVFAGYGIVAPEYDYNSYLTTDVKGKIAVILSGEPESEDDIYFNGKYQTVHSSVEIKQRIAFSRGAAGCIIIDMNIVNASPDYKSLMWRDIGREYSFERISLTYSVATNMSIFLKPGLVPLLFQGSGYSFADVQKYIKNNSLFSFPLNSRISFKGWFRERDFISPNIAGFVAGRSPQLKDSYLIISAHYDHLGIGTPVEDDSVYNGVCDNALGTAVLLELARHFKDYPPGRSVLIIFFTGEEAGLVGSAYYTDHPLVPLASTIANINIDDICFLDRMKNIRGIGSEYSSLHKTLTQTAAAFGLSIDSQMEGYHEPFYASDHFSFAKAGIPSILITEGGEFEHFSRPEAFTYLDLWMKNIYHSPFDDLNQKISYEAVIQHAQIIGYFCRITAEMETPPEWNEKSSYYRFAMPAGSP